MRIEASGQKFVWNEEKGEFILTIQTDGDATD